MRRTTLSFILLLFGALEGLLWAHGKNSDNGTVGRSTDRDDCGKSGKKSASHQGPSHFDPYTGNSHRASRDLEVWGGVGEHQLVFVRYHNTRIQGLEHRINRQFGTAGNWRHEYQWSMFQDSATEFTIFYPDGKRNTFHPVGGDEFASTPAVRERLFQSGDNFFLQNADGFRYRFRRLTGSSGEALFQMQDFRDSQQNLYRLTYTTDGRVIGVSEPAGRFLMLAYAFVGGHVVLSSVSTSDGRSVSYTYDAFADGVTTWVRLLEATYGDGAKAVYTYSQAAVGAQPLLDHAIDPRLIGQAVNMRFEYQTEEPGEGPGVLSKERNGVTGAEMVSLVITGPTQRVVEYANGRTVLIGHIDRGNVSSELDGLDRPTEFAYDQHGFGLLIAREDALGRVTRFTNTKFGNLLSRTYPDNTVESWTRDDLDLVLSQTDELGRVTKYTRDSAHRITQIDYPDGTLEKFKYNSFSQVLVMRLRNGGLERHVYDAQGLETHFTDGLENPPTEYGYDSFDRLASTTDARGNTTGYEYDERGLLVKVINADGPFRTFGYDTFGNRISETNEIGNTWRTRYDEFRRVVSMTDPLGRVTQFKYDLPGGICGCQHAENRPTRIILPSGKTTKIEYDLEWQKTSETAGFGTIDAATTRFGYDDAGNLTRTTDPLGRVWATTYDDRDRLIASTDPLGNTTAFRYDAVGNLLAVKRPDGGITSNIYDSMNLLAQTTNPQGEVIRLEHDDSDNLATVTDPRGNVYRFTYDLLDRQLALIYPDGSRESFTYDSVDNIETYTTRAGQVRRHSYDSRNRETDSIWNDTTPGITRTYDDASRLATMVSGVSALAFGYDAANQLLSETQTVAAAAGPSKVVSYGYDLDGNRLHLMYPDRATIISYAYTGRNQIAAIGAATRPVAAPSGRGAWATTYTYDLSGNRVGKTLENGTATDYAYDDANRMLTVDHQRLGASFARFDYDYDNVDRRRFVRRDQARGDAFAYDRIDQVTAVQYDAVNPDTAPTDALRVVAYGYDAAGNRTRVSDSGSRTRYLSNNLNQYTWIEGQLPTYDRNGNLAAHNGWTYDYDAQSRLVSAVRGSTSVAFAYDPLNRCVRRAVNGIPVFLYYDDWTLIDERDGADTLLARYIHGARTDEMLARLTPATSVYYHHDSMGTVTHLTDVGGAVAESYSYDIFGAPTIRDGDGEAIAATAVGNRFLFTGREFLPEAGVYDYRHRFYSHHLGRFLEPDPVRFDAGDSNLYRYVFNNPINRLDPFGLKMSKAECDAMAALIARLADRFEATSALLEKLLIDQRDLLSTLFWIDRAADTGFTVAGAGLGNAINSARVGLTSRAIGFGESRGVDLARGGTFYGEGISTSTRFVTPGIGGAAVGGATATVIGKGAVTPGHGPATRGTRGVADRIQQVIDSVNQDLNDLSARLSDLRKTFREECCQAE